MKGDFAILNLRSDDPIQFTGTVNIPENWAPPINRWAPNSFEVVQ
jgi:hypothetical protein